MLDVPGPIDMATVYVPGHIGVRVMEDIAKKGIPEVWLNPGADDDEVVARARELGVKIIQACSIMAIGDSSGTVLTVAEAFPVPVRSQFASIKESESWRRETGCRKLPRLPLTPARAGAYTATANNCASAPQSDIRHATHFRTHHQHHSRS